MVYFSIIIVVYFSDIIYTQASSVIGLTANSIGNYDYSPKLKFDATDDYLIIQINEAGGKLFYDIKGNSFSGGTFKVQTSADGETYTDLKTYTSLATTTHESFDLTTSVRFIKWIYTNRSSGNVALGNIGIKCEAVTLTDAGLATYANDLGLDFTNVSNLEAYIAKENGSKIDLEKVNKVPSGTGILLRSPNKGTYFVVPVATSTDAMTGNIFVRGTGVAVESGSGPYNYVLGKHSGVVGFYKAGGVSVATNKAYIQTSIAAARLDLSFDDGEITGISELKMEKDATNAGVYDLQGRKVANPTKGLYIVNGKKIVVK